MAQTVLAIFRDSQNAGDAVADLKEAGFTEEISVIARDNDGQLSEHAVESDVREGAATGAAVGGALGALGGILAGAFTVTVPAGTLLVLGPLAAALGLTGGGAGALTGGLVGGLVDYGVQESTAKEYEDYVLNGEVLLAVEADDENLSDVESILRQYQARTSFIVESDD